MPPNRDQALRAQSADALESLGDLLFRRYTASASILTSEAPRIIVVVGAAASQRTGLPFWDDLKREVLDQAADCFARRSLFIEECWRQLGPSIALPDTFANWSEAEAERHLLDKARVEDLCGVALQYNVLGERIVKHLQRRLDPAGRHTAGPPPQLGYELLAHMLKHGFIDHLITFNFDTLLDDAVVNELGHGDYDRIVSDHCDVSSFSPANPKLIKLHGSIDAPPTLRFTPKETAVLPERTIALLDNTVFGRDGTSRSTPASPVHIVSLGYKWSDGDFASWLISRRQLIERVIVVNRQGRVPNQLTAISSQVLPLSTDALHTSVDGRLTTDDLLWVVWNLLEARLRDSGIPRMPAARHVILGYLFGTHSAPDAMIEDRSSLLNQHTPRIRFLAELYLHLVKCKGMINCSVMANDERVHRYYSAGITPRQPEESIDVDDPLERLTGRFIVRSPLAHARETYFAQAVSGQDLFRAFIREFGCPPLDVPKYLDRQVTWERQYGETFLQRELQKIYEGPEVEVIRRPSPPNEWQFSRATPLTTYYALQRRTLDLLTSARWSSLLVIAESGAWLVEDAVARAIIEHEPPNGAPLQILLLQAADPETWALRKGIQEHVEEGRRRLEATGRVTVTMGSLPWWQHNRHLSLALGPDHTCTGGIYFRRRLKASKINPVYVDGRDVEDAAELLFMFMSYVRRATRDCRRDSRSDNDRLLAATLEVTREIVLPRALGRRLEELREQLRGLQRPDQAVPAIRFGSGDQQLAPEENAEHGPRPKDTAEAEE